MLLVFWIIFSLPVISRIESIGGGRAVGGGGRRGLVGGWVGSQRQANVAILTQAAVLCLQYGTRTGTIHRVNQNWCEEQLGTPCSPINAPQDREMHPRGLTASVKAVCESKPGHLSSSTWCFWVVPECSFHVQTKSGIQLMCK